MRRSSALHCSFVTWVPLRTERHFNRPIDWLLPLRTSAALIKVGFDPDKGWVWSDEMQQLCEACSCLPLRCTSALCPTPPLPHLHSFPPHGWICAGPTYWKCPPPPPPPPPQLHTCTVSHRTAVFVHGQHTENAHHRHHHHHHHHYHHHTPAECPTARLSSQGLTKAAAAPWQRWQGPYLPVWTTQTDEHMHV